MNNMNFDIKKYLTENTLTTNSNQLKELDVRKGSNILYLVLEEPSEDLLDHGIRNGTLESVGKDIFKDLPDNLLSAVGHLIQDAMLFVNEGKGLAIIEAYSREEEVGSVILISPVFPRYRELRDEPNLVTRYSNMYESLLEEVHSQGSRNVAIAFLKWTLS